MGAMARDIPRGCARASPNILQFATYATARDTTPINAPVMGGGVYKGGAKAERKEKEKVNGVLLLKAEARARAGRRAKVGEKAATAKEMACGVLTTINGSFSPARVQAIRDFPRNT